MLTKTLKAKSRVNIAKRLFVAEILGTDAKLKLYQFGNTLDKLKTRLRPAD